ncbi:MAG: hypothetical protein IPP49_02110 [Saprospiraceae bacterium]|nr:hypothetical protein [Saprospiraceae bacterium]
MVSSGKININDIQEMDDGSIVVEEVWEFGIPYPQNITPGNESRPLMGASIRSSHVDKWWYFPEEIAPATEELISHGNSPSTPYQVMM